MIIFWTTSGDAVHGGMNTIVRMRKILINHAPSFLRQHLPFQTRAGAVQRRGCGAHSQRDQCRSRGSIGWLTHDDLPQHLHDLAHMLFQTFTLCQLCVACIPRRDIVISVSPFGLRSSSCGPSPQTADSDHCHYHGNKKNGRRPRDGAHAAARNIRMRGKRSSMMAAGWTLG
jgi:hypothetical protein